MTVNKIPETWQQDVPLASYTTLQVGGVAEFFTTVTTKDELRAATQTAQEMGVPITILGGGSNLLIADSGIPGLVIHMKIDGIAADVGSEHVLVHCGAGNVLDDLVTYTVDQNWWGLENLSAIPGTVGATAVQNVGAYGVEVADIIESVTVYDYVCNQEFRLTATDCDFTYRNSIFKTAAAAHWIITAITFRLSSEPRPQLTYADLQALQATTLLTPATVRACVIEIRAHKFPDWRLVGTAGSFFKNPIIGKEQYEALRSRYPSLPGHAVSDNRVKVPLGWILDHVCGLRGYSDGIVGTYEKQALVLVHNGAATATDIQRFATYIQEQVAAATDIDIMYEVTVAP